MSTTTLDELIDRYCAAWSAPDPAERERLLRETLTDDATYTDPRTAPVTRAGLLEHIARVLASRPGARVLRTSAVDVHHGLARFHWCVELPDGTRLPEGIDVVELSDDGRQLRRVVGFFGPLAPRAPVS